MLNRKKKKKGEKRKIHGQFISEVSAEAGRTDALM